jgi:hypothetical protein
VHVQLLLPLLHVPQLLQLLHLLPDLLLLLQALMLQRMPE